MTTTAGFTPRPYSAQFAAHRLYPFLGYASAAGAVIDLDAIHGRSEGMDLGDALSRADLDFTAKVVGVQSRPLPDDDGITGDAEVMDFPDHRAVIRINADGSKSPLSVMKSRYRVVQYADAFAFGQTLIDDFGASVCAAAAYGRPMGVGGVVVFRLDRALLINDEDVIELFALLRSSHDGSSNVSAEVIPVHQLTGAVVNTEIPGRPQQWNIRHSGDISAKFADAENTMRMVEEWAVAFRGMTSQMLGRGMTSDEFATFTHRVLPTPRGVGEKSRTDWAERRRALTSLYETSPNVAFGHGTCYAAYMAYCEYADHFSPARGADPQHQRNTRVVDGSAAKAKVKAWNHLMQIVNT